MEEQEQQHELQVNVTFSELQVFDIADVSSLISKENALKICNASLQNFTAKTVEVLTLWLRKLLRAYLIKDECCLDILKHLYEWFILLKNQISAENQTACSDFGLLLSDALEFCVWAKDKLIQAGESLVHTTSFFLLAIVYSCLQQRNELNVQTPKEQEPQAIELLAMVLQLLQEITSTSNKVQARITPLLRQLVEISDFLSVNSTHLHIFVKTSKAMTSICTHYLNCEDFGHNEAKTMPDWLKETVIHLCDTVLNHMENVYQTDSSSVALDKMEEYLKVTQAYLIMLMKLFSCGVGHMDKTVSYTLIMLLNSSEPKYCEELSTDISQLIAKYVRPYIMQLHWLIYQQVDFQQHLINFLAMSLNPTVEDSYEICLDFVTITIMDDGEISQQTYKTLQKIFEYLLNDACNFTHAARYARLMEAYGSLLHVADSPTLFKYFLAGIFQEDLIKSQGCADVLMLSFRLEETNGSWSRDYVLQATNYWQKCNDSYALFSQNPSQFHVQRMLRYFHKLARKELPTFNLRSYRYLHCVSDGTESEQKLWLMRLQRILREPLSDKEQYYEMLALMELLARGPVEWLQQLTGPGVELLLSSDNARLWIGAYFKLVLQADPPTQMRVLQGTMPALSTCWQLQRFLYACKTSENVQLKSLAEKHKISTELLPLLKAMQPAATVDRSNLPNIHIKYHELSYKKYQNHRCATGESLKRKRCRPEPKELLRDLEENSQQLQECAAQMDESDKLQLRSLINNLKRIM